MIEDGQVVVPNDRLLRTVMATVQVGAGLVRAVRPVRSVQTGSAQVQTGSEPIVLRRF